jgi:hypothetical protein
MRLKKYLLWLALMPLAFGCSDAWDDHTKVNGDVSNQTLWEYMQATPDLSEFTNFVKIAQLESVFAELQLRTAYIPNNQAMAALGEAMVSNEDQIRKFVLNHITLGQYKALSLKGSLKFKMLSGKVLVLDADANNLDGIAIDITTEMQLVNGILTIVNAPVVPRINVWEYIETLAPVNKHTSYLKSLTGNVFVDSLSTQTGVNENGQPIYDSVFVWQNQFCVDVADLTSEDSTFTFFVVEDAVYDAEYDKFKSFFKVVNGTTPRDSALVKSKVVKDYAFTTAYSRNELPAFLTSIYGVAVPVSDAVIVEEFKASNGYVYVLSACDIAQEEKIKPIVVQAETKDSYYALATEKGQAYRYLRLRNNSQGGFDVVVDNWNATVALSDGYIMRAGETSSMRYKCYWRAMNDFNSSFRNPVTVMIPDTVNAPGVVDPRWDISQKLGYCVAKTIGENGRVTEFAPPTFITPEFVPVPRKAAYEGTAENPLDETYLGEVSFTTVNDIYLQLVPSMSRVGVTADYIKLVPVFN